MSRGVEAVEVGAPTEKIRDLVQIRVAHLGPAVTKIAMQLLNGWWRAGYRSEPHVLALVDWYVAKHATIGKPFAYFNAKSQAFRDMHESIAGRVAEAEGDRMKALDKSRERTRAARLHEVRNPGEGDTP